MSGAGAGRVLLLVGHSTGGIGGHVASLATGLARHGWQTAVATSAGTAARFDLGDRVETLWPAAGVRSLRHLPRLRRLAAGADVVHAHGHQAGLLALAVTATLSPRRRPAVVVSWHNAVLGGGPRRLLTGAAERLQARRAHLVTGASADLVERAAALGAAGARLAPVPPPAARPAAGSAAAAAGQVDAGVAGQVTRADVAAGLGADPAARWVLTVSRVAPQKDLATLVAAAAHPEAPDGTLWLVVGDGDPGLAARLRAQARRTAAPVRLVGARRDVPALMALADVFVLTSLWEARALVVQEAMAAGTPVVCTAVGGLPELLSGAGLLVPPRDPAALAGAVAAVLADPALAGRLGDAGRARFAGLPGEAEVLAGWAATYTALRAARGTPGRRRTGGGVDG